MKTIKKLIRLSLIGLFFFAMASCESGGIEADAKRAANYRCKMVKANEKIGTTISKKRRRKYRKEASTSMKRMNNIRKKYLDGDQAKKFDSLFVKFKEECGG
ncbi:hypothetical protein BKI52_14620 [marine bacterium AO1-C]|nr:hypothetical protein BKI52_14620 [marine bacterium AO1-C]